MLNESELVFDEHMIASGGALPTTATAYAGLVHSEKFSKADQIGIFIVVTIPATGSATVEAQIEHCSDGVHWQNKNDTEEIDKSSWSGVGEQAVFGGETQPARPTLEFVRLRITLTGFASRVKAYMVGRLKEEPKQACSCTAASTTSAFEAATPERDGDGSEPPPDPDDGGDMGHEDEGWFLDESEVPSASERGASGGDFEMGAGAAWPQQEEVPVPYGAQSHELPPGFPHGPFDLGHFGTSGGPQSCSATCISCGSVNCPSTGVCVLSNTKASAGGGQESSIAWNESPDGAEEGITMVFYRDDVDSPHAARFAWSKAPGEPLSWTDKPTAEFKPDTGPLAQGGTCAQAQRAAAMNPVIQPSPCGFWGDPIAVAIPAALATDPDAGLVSTPGWFALIALATDPRGKTTASLGNGQNVVMGLTTDGGVNFQYSVVNAGNLREGGKCDRPTAAVDPATGDVWVQWANKTSPKKGKRKWVMLVRRMKVRAVLDELGKPSKAMVTPSEVLTIPTKNYPMKPGGVPANYGHANMVVLNDGQPEILLVSKTALSRSCAAVAGPVSYGLVTNKPQQGPDWRTHVIYEDLALPTCVGPGFNSTSPTLGGLHYPWLMRALPGLQVLGVSPFLGGRNVLFAAVVASVVAGSKIIVRMSGQDRDTWTTILSSDDLPDPTGLTPISQGGLTVNAPPPTPPWHWMPSMASIQFPGGGGQLALSWREARPGGKQIVRGTIVNVGSNGSIGLLPAVDLSTTAVPCSTSGAQVPWRVPSASGRYWPGDYNWCTSRPGLGDFVCTFADQRGSYLAGASNPAPVAPSAWVAVFGAST